MGNDDAIHYQDSLSKSSGNAPRASFHDHEEKIYLDTILVLNQQKNKAEQIDKHTTAKLKT